MGFEHIGGEEPWRGQVLGVRVDRFRHEDGKEVTREYSRHPGAAVIVAHDGDRLYVVSQPREAVGEQSLLELPAGKVDEEGEGPLETAKRELAEEIGKGAGQWRHLTTVYASPGFSDEEMHIYLATDLHDASADSTEEERIEVESIPLPELDDAIARCRDAKSVIGMLWLRAYGERSG